MTLAAPYQPYLLIYKLAAACYTAPPKNTVTALLEYIDLLNRYSRDLDGPPWAPLRLGPRGSLLPPLWAALYLITNVMSCEQLLTMC